MIYPRDRTGVPMDAFELLTQWLTARMRERVPETMSCPISPVRWS